MIAQSQVRTLKFILLMEDIINHYFHSARSLYKHHKPWDSKEKKW